MQNSQQQQKNQYNTNGAIAGSSIYSKIWQKNNRGRWDELTLL